MDPTNPLNIPIISGTFIYFGAIMGAAIGLAGLYFSQKWILEREKEIKNYEKRIAVFSDIMGIKALFVQYNVTRYEAFIFSDFYEFQAHKQGLSLDSFEFKEAIRHAQRSEALVLEIAKVKQQLFEKLGAVKILFVITKEVDALINDINTFKSINIKRPTLDMSVAEMEAHKVTAVRELEQLCKKEYGDKIDNLLNYLEKRVNQKKA